MGNVFSMAKCTSSQDPKEIQERDVYRVSPNRERKGRKRVSEKLRFGTVIENVPQSGKNYFQYVIINSPVSIMLLKYFFPFIAR